MENEIYNKDEKGDINLLLSRIKKSPELFKDKILSKLDEFVDYYNIVKNNPSSRNDNFIKLTMFFCQMFEFYPKDLSFIIENIQLLIDNYLDILHPSIRYKILQAIMVIQKKGFLTIDKALPFFLKVLLVEDKDVRYSVIYHLINLYKLSKKKNLKKIKSFSQNYIQELTNYAKDDLIKRTMKIMIILYNKMIWRDTKTINIIGTGALSLNSKISYICCKFLIQSTENVTKYVESDVEDEDDINDMISKTSKKATKKIETLKKQLKNAKRKQHRRQKIEVSLNVFPIDHIYNPQRFVDEMFKNLKKSKEIFKVRLIKMAVISRLIGRHKLILPNYYNYLLNYTKTSAKDASKILSYIAESTHQIAPFDEIHLLGKEIIDNFVSEGYNNEKITMGLNCLREMVLRMPFIFDQDEIYYLCRFKNFKEKNVSNAARSLINLYRDVNPDLLKKEFRGRPDDEEKYYLSTTKHLTGISESIIRIDGIELLNEDEGKDVESKRLLTEYDFRKIRKLKKKKILDKIKRQEYEYDIKEKAIHLPDENIFQILEKYKNNNEENNDDQSDISYINSDYESDLNEKDDNSLNEISSSSDEESDEDYLDKQGFIKESNIKNFKKNDRKNNIKSQEYLDLLESKKMKNQKLNKKGSKTNKEKNKNKPILMLKEKIKFEKSQISCLTKKIAKIKNQKGHCSKKMGKRKK